MQNNLLFTYTKDIWVLNIYYIPISENYILNNILHDILTWNHRCIYRIDAIYFFVDSVKYRSDINWVCYTKVIEKHY